MFSLFGFGFVRTIRRSEERKGKGKRKSTSATSVFLVHIYSTNPNFSPFSCLSPSNKNIHCRSNPIPIKVHPFQLFHPSPLSHQPTLVSATYNRSASPSPNTNMKTVQSLLPVFGLVAAAQAWDQWKNTTTSEPVVWTTVTTDVYTTFWYGKSSSHCT